MERKTIGYIRCSTEEQAKEGVSADTQKQAIESYCKLKKLALQEIILDLGVSGTRPLSERPNGRRLLESNAVAIVAVKLDRIFRDCVNCLTCARLWEKRGVALHIIDMGGNSLDTSTAVGLMFLTMASGFAEMEAGLIRERTRAALQEKRRQGKIAGAVPFGFDLADDRDTLVINEREQKALALIQKLKTAKVPFRKIARELELRGIRTKRGNAVWQASSVRSVLRHARNTHQHLQVPQDVKENC